MASSKQVSALQRGLSVLASVSKLGHATVAEVRELTRLDKATIIRMLETLAHEGYIERHPLDLTYYLTGRMADIGRGFEPHARLAQLTGPLLREFRTDVGWPTDFAVPDGDAMFIIDPGGGEPVPLLAGRPPNYRPDLLLAPLGLAYSAFCTDEEQRRILGGLSRTAPPEARKLLRNKARARQLFEHVRKAGYATTDPDYAKRMGGENLLCIGVPVTDLKRVYGAVCLFLVRSSVSEKTAQRIYVPRLKDLAGRLINKLEHEQGAFPSGPDYRA
jgi:IclR family transcriptional regulator, mhp operon transcriptional activator